MSKRAEQAAENIGYIGISYKAVKIFKEGVKAGYEQAEKDMIERACEWLEQALTHGCHPCSGSRLVMEFRKAMEEG